MKNETTHPEVFIDYIPLPYGGSFEVVSLVGMPERFATYYIDGKPFLDEKGQAGEWQIFDNQKALEDEVERIFREVEL